MLVETYCGGAVETNGYLIYSNGKALLIDAPEGMADWVQDCLQNQPAQLAALLLTHGHWDHILDASLIQKKFKIPVWIHSDSLPLIENPKIQEAFYPFGKITPCKADRVLNREDQVEIDGFNFRILLCPGHCPGSLCFYFKEDQQLFSGDVIFSGSVGRWDLPGGSREQLLTSLQTKILVLPDETQIFPGHGASTTIGIERRTNPYV